MKINILGTEYDFQIVNKEDDKRLGNKDGYCDMYEKTIRVVDVKEYEDDIDQCKNLKEYIKKISRHEIVHAFLCESGLCENTNSIESWAYNEEMVDWIAFQFPKMLEVFRQVDAL